MLPLQAVVPSLWAELALPERPKHLLDVSSKTNPEGHLPAKNKNTWAMVLAQLTEQSLLTPLVYGLNPIIGKIL